MALRTPVIAIVYDRSVRSDTTGEHCRRALEAFAEVVYFPPERMHLIPPVGFDLYVNIDDGFHYPFRPDLHPSAWWVIDTHLTYEEDREKARSFDYLFAAQRDGAAQLRADGIVPAWWLPLGANPALHRPMPVAAKDLDLAFVGNPASPERVRWLEVLAARYPSSYFGNAYGDEMAEIYSRARIVFNVSVKNDINMRVFEALACGSLLVTNDLAENGQDELFTPGKHLITYRDEAELLRAIDYYLEHEEERETIARAGCELVHRAHTYEHRMRGLVEQCTYGAFASPPGPLSLTSCGSEEGGQPASPPGPLSLTRYARDERGSDQAGALGSRGLQPADGQPASPPGPLGGSVGASCRSPVEEAPEGASGCSPVEEAPDWASGCSPVEEAPEGASGCSPVEEAPEWASGCSPLQGQMEGQASPEGASRAKPFGYYRHARPDLLELVPQEARRVLDFGCGAGCLGEALKRRQECAVVGVELNPYAAAEAEQRLDEVVTSDITAVGGDLLPRDFDCLVLGDVLEHLTDPWAVLRRLVGHLQEGGTVVASFPNARSWDVLEALGTGAWQYRDAGVLDEGHLRFFTLSDAVRTLTEAGLTVEEVRGVGGRGEWEWSAAGRPEQVRIGPLTLDCSQEAAREFLVDQFLLRAVKRPVAAPGLVSIVILCMNQLDYTRQCVESILAHTEHPYELVFVDNGSTDETAAYLAGIPRAKVITNAENQGFPKGCNQGIAASVGEHILLLNNDTIVTPGWLTGLVQLAESDERIGLIGPVSNNVSGPQQVPTSYGTIGEMHREARRLAAEHGRALVDCERLVGFCLLVKRSVLAAIGGLDERFGLGLFEDDDLCRRAAEAGYRLVYAPGVFVHHFGSRTITSLGLDAGGLLRENLAKYEEKWGEQGRGPQSSDANIAPVDRERRATTVSLCMIVRNEEHHLPRCLASVAGVFDEVIVVDTGSEDRTREIAEEHGARIFEFRWVDDFSAARNESLSHATSEWVMWLDADDSLDDENRARLARLLAGLDDRAMAYVMKVRCLAAGDGAVTDVDHVKLFRNDPELRFEYRVHEQILPAIRRRGGAVVWSDVVITHHGYADASTRAGKLARDRRILEEELRRVPDDPFCLFNLGCIEQELGEREAAVEALERSIALSDPHASQVRKCYALILQMQRELGRLEEARATEREAFTHYASDPEVLFQAGMLHRALGNLHEAEDRFVRALGAPAEAYFSSLDPTVRGYKARHNLAEVYLAMRRLPECERECRAVLAERPGFEPAVRLLGYALLQSGRLHEAEPELRALTRIAPDDAEAHHNLAVLLGELGRPAEAAVALAEARTRGWRDR